VFEVTDAMIAAAKVAADEASLAALAEAPQADQPSDPNAIGEVTRHLIEQSGASRRNPPWKIALFVVSLIGLPVSILSLLSSLHVAVVTVVNDRGEEVQEPFFSAEGVSGLRDLLLGNAEQKRAEAKAQAVKRRAASVPTPVNAGGTAPELREPEAGSETGTVDTSEALSAFYNDSEKKDRGPKVRGGDAAAAAKAHAGGLDETEAAKVVGHSQTAFEDCIVSGLRRNPSLKVGKVSMTVTVAPSGTVKGAALRPKVHESTEWGACLIQRARRMVFPPFEGDEEAEIEVPLVVGVAM
jgi:hypothetical protein